MALAPRGMRSHPVLERVKGIEPSLRAWEARVLPLNYTRDRPESTKRAVSSEERHHPPDSHHQPDDDEEADPSRAVGSLLDPVRCGPPAMLPPGEAVADEHRQSEGDDQFGEEALHVEDVVHAGDSTAE